jgi:ABC-type amino acid transport substrate-binding protein
LLKKVSKIPKVKNITVPLIQAQHVVLVSGERILSQGKNQSPKIFSTHSQSELIRSIEQGKADYMLIAPEEANDLIRAVGLKPDSFAMIDLSEIPAGNLRYLMCNQAVTDETLQRINYAIAKYFPVHQ